MRNTSILLVILAAQCAAQDAPPAPPKPAPDTVIATVDGKKLTYGELDGIVHGLSPQLQQNLARDPKQFIQQFALMQRLSELAEKAKLDEKSPYKEALAYNRMNILMQAEINDAINSFPVLMQEQQKYYDEHKDRYQQVSLKVIYIPFSSNATAADGKKRLTETEARQKAEELAKAARGGADFVKLVKENSEDETSKSKDGDFGTISKSDNLPPSIRSVVFTLKAGDVSDPVRQPNGFYIFRAESVSEKPFSEVSSQIYNDLKNAKLKEWLDSTTKSLNIKFENEQVFTGGAQPKTAVK
ncbi:MAG TPA: peptidylprolyl isomerase [Bryobacteraceae bacterium]|nr:peptidylprolyl isomerase [Bryobacteraceae bacterium]